MNTMNTINMDVLTNLSFSFETEAVCICSQYFIHNGDDIGCTIGAWLNFCYCLSKRMEFDFKPFLCKPHVICMSYMGADKNKINK